MGSVRHEIRIGWDLIVSISSWGRLSFLFIWKDRIFYLDCRNIVFSFMLIDCNIGFMVNV